MAVHVGRKALKSRRDQMGDSAATVEKTGDAATVCLLLFYAAECGLKERLLVRGAMLDTSKLEATHDLRRIAKDLRLPQAVWNHLQRLRKCRLNSPAHGSVDVHELHQAWRYGAKLNAADETAASEALRAVINWCKQD